MNRRQFGAGVLAAAAAPVGIALSRESEMFGMIGKMRAQPGRRADLVEILLNAIPGMDGCISYIIAEDLEDDDAFWINEVWRDEASHQAALESDRVRAAITQGRPLIAEMSLSVRTRPVGGVGL